MSPAFPKKAGSSCACWTEGVVVGVCSQGHVTGRCCKVSRRALLALKSTVLYVTRIRFYIVTRKCSRPVCKEDASLTLTYQYSRALVWIDDLALESDPHAYDLCEQHGRRLTVPGGWRMEDRRDRFRLIVPNRLAG
jgi:hypothetical protein